jgi:hypothetical protein
MWAAVDRIACYLMRCMVWYGMVWYGTAWYGMVCDVVLCSDCIVQCRVTHINAMQCNAVRWNVMQSIMQRCIWYSIELGSTLNDNCTAQCSAGQCSAFPSPTPCSPLQPSSPAPHADAYTKFITIQYSPNDCTHGHNSAVQYSSMQYSREERSEERREKGRVREREREE